MQKLIIGAVVGSLILFIWQFLSWALLDIHGSQMSYTPKQEAVMEALAATDLEEGQYFMIRAPHDASQEEAEAVMAEREGKPWALLTYHESMTNNQGMNMLRGWLIDLVSVFLLCWILLNIVDLDFMKTLKIALAIGVISYLTIPYLNSIWFQGNSIPDLIDAIAQWGICGAWLGWWLNR